MRKSTPYHGQVHMRRDITLGAGLSLLAAFSLLAAGWGCSSDEPGRPPVYLDSGVKLDGIQWPDWGGPPKYDWGSIKLDQGWIPPQDGQVPGDGTPGDSQSITDGSTGCPGPAGVSCAPACQSGELCTEASGGRCAKVFTLSGPASNKPVLLQVALAYVECWNKGPSVDTLCATFDTCGMTGTLDENMVKNWVCNTAQVSDFPNAATHDKAKEVCGCAIYQQYKPDWKVSSMPASEKGKVCLSYDVISWWPDDMDVDLCKSFPPK